MPKKSQDGLELLDMGKMYNFPISGFGSRMEHILLLMGIIVVSSLIIAGRIK